MVDFPFYIQYSNGNYTIRYAAAENPMLTPSEVKTLIPIFEKYISEHTDEEINKVNKELLNEFRNSWNLPKETKANSYTKGYVYLFECGGKYKIGVSQDVSRRIKDLDHRPFKVTLISKVHSKMAYKVEGTIHNFLKKYKIEGEWYDFPTAPTAEWFESFVKRIEDDIGRNEYV